MRLDNYLVVNNYFDSRTKAKQAIERGEILINSKVIVKASYEIEGEVTVQRVCDSEYVSLGGFKLEKALTDFNLDVKNMIVADVGASTGGFTDCLIKNGAKKVYSVDLRDDLLHESLVNNNKVVQIVKNAKELLKTDFSDQIDLLVADLSFISITQVLKVFADLIDDEKKLIVLIKPQFETGGKTKFKNGIIRDAKLQKNVCRNVYDYAKTCNLSPKAITTAPAVLGKNQEFLILLEKGGAVTLSDNFTDYLL